MEVMLAQADFVFISFGGLIKVASIAEEMKNPGKVIPLGMLLSLTVVGVTYLIVIFVTIAVMGEKFTGSTSLIFKAAEVLMQHRGRVLYSIATIAVIVTLANADIMTASRYPLALARDEMLPSFFARINDAFKTPHTSISSHRSGHYHCHVFRSHCAGQDGIERIDIHLHFFPVWPWSSCGKAT